MAAQACVSQEEEAGGCSTLNTNLPSCPLFEAEPPPLPPHKVIASPSYGLRLIPIQGLGGMLLASSLVLHGFVQ